MTAAEQLVLVYCFIYIFFWVCVGLRVGVRASVDVCGAAFGTISIAILLWLGHQRVSCRLKDHRKAKVLVAHNFNPPAKESIVILRQCCV